MASLKMCIIKTLNEIESHGGWGRF